MTLTLQKDSILALCEEVAQPQQLRVFQPGTAIVSPGKAGAFVYVIKSGIFKFGIKYNQLPLTIEFLFSGYITGLNNLHQAINYPCFVHAISESSVYVWEREKILELMKIMPEFSVEFQKDYSDWGLRILERLRSLVFMLPFQRVASWIYDYGKNEYYRLNNVWSALSVKDMAEYCNVSEFEFKNATKKLVRSKIVALSEKDIHIRNWEKLSYIINSQV